MRNLFKNFYVFSIIFLLNFISIFFIWIKRKFGDVSLENIFYHFNSFFDGNILLPDHHLEESLVYYVININFLFSSFIFLFWFILKKFSDDRSSKSILNFINMISKVFINYYLIWIFLILVLGFSLFSFLKNINELNSKTSFLEKDYKKIEINNLNNINNKNLILIYVESLDQNFRNFDNQNLLPSFSKLQTQYLNVNKFEQLKSIDWTIAGIFSSQCGIPLIDYSVLNKNINCLPDILKKNSYKNFFVIGHESKFQNLNTFLSNHNYDKIIDKKFIETNYNYVNQNTGWGNGFNDNVLFEVVHDTIKQNKKNNFFISILTSNTHGPLGEMQKDCRYKYNIQSLEESILCFDKKLSNFLNILIENYLDNTVIVVISDHLMLNGMRYYKKYFSENTRYLTNSFISKSLKMDKFIKNRETMNHYDLLPTILNLTNVYEGSDVALGISLLNENYSEEEAKRRNSFLDKTNYSLKEYNEILQ